MCGILGSVNFSFHQQELDLISHRGPDDSGIDNFQIGDHEVIFGQRRLSIIDLSPAGHQPMKSFCGGYALIFNGEIYNHLDLKTSLPDSIPFKGHSDTETILYYLIEFGVDGLKDLNGIFSLAFLDFKNKSLLIARDPFGIKPLYYHINKYNQVIFASEIRPIKSMINPQTIDKASMGSLLRLRYNPAPDTLYEEIKKLRPGHLLSIGLEAQTLEISNVPFLNKVPPTVSMAEEEAVLKYGEYFESAVKRQLLSDVPIGILLSGGVDSAMVAAVAQKYSTNQLKAFTIGFEGNHQEDEINDAAETASLLGLDHYYKKISFEDFLGLFKECIRIVEEPLATTSIIPMYYLSKLASEHVKVVLTGQGADEPLGGYPRYKSEIVASKIPAKMQKLSKSLLSVMPLKSEKLSRGRSTLGIEDDLDRFLATYEIFNNSDILELIGVSDQVSRERLKYFFEILDCKRKQHSVEKMMALDSRMNLADDLLIYTDKITMNFALECRVPILDVELVNFIDSLPYSYKLNFSSGKLIHKKFAKSILPDKIIHRKKKGFQSPTQLWFKNESAIIKDILMSKENLFSSLFNQNKVLDVIKQHEQGYPMEKQIFLLLSIYYFLEEFQK